GRIATPTGHSHYINGAAGREHLHRLRALVDAIVVGVATVVADDPQLTVRLVHGPCPARVVLDPSGRAAAVARVLPADWSWRLVAGITATGEEVLFAWFIPAAGLRVFARWAPAGEAAAPPAAGGGGGGRAASFSVGCRHPLTRLATRADLSPSSGRGEARPAP